MENGTAILVTTELDIVSCRKAVRDLASELGLSIADQTRLVTAVSELARNIVQYAGKGSMSANVVHGALGDGIMVVFEDSGPGLDPEEALRPGFTSGKGLGMGLPGAKRLMDEFELRSAKGVGTTVTAVKWQRR